MTPDQIRSIAAEVLERHGHQILRALGDHEVATQGTSAAGPANLVYLMEIFGRRLVAEGALL